ncbi:MAG: patatin-like phospholipase family protein [Balneolales bacterium]
MILWLPVCSSAQTDENRVGLVLSGGGAKGFAHIGVLKVLEEVNMPIDVITGTSMGSVIGALYALGYSAEDMEKIVLETDWADVFSDDVNRRYIPIEEKVWDSKFLITLPIDGNRVRLPSGLVQGHKVGLFFTRLIWPYHQYEDFAEFPLSFASVATDLETGEAVVFREGYLVDALRASSAIPSIFSPVEIDGRLLIDGGLVRNLPVQDAIDLGATYTLAVNASTQLLDMDRIVGLADVLNQTINLQMLVNIKEQEKLTDMLLHPDLEGFSMMDFDRAESIIQLGEDGARANINRLKQIADSLNSNHTPVVRAQRETVVPIYIEDITFDGLDQMTADQALIDLGISPFSFVTFDEIEEGMARLFGLHLFDRVSYRLTRSGYQYKLIIDVTENTRNLFRFGFRYDSWTRASLLINTTFRNVWSRNSTLRLNSRFGEQLELNGQYSNYFGNRPKLAAGIDLNFTRYYIDQYSDAERIANINTDAVFSELYLGTMFSTLAMGGGGIRQEVFNQSTRIGTDRSAEGWSNFTSFFATFWLESYDRAVFPTQGHSLRLRSEFALPELGTVAFNRHELDWGSYFQISRRMTMHNRLYLGQAFGPGLPFHHQFFLGGYPRFPGYYLYELAGESVVALRGDLRYEIMNQRYVLFGGNAGNTFDKLTLDHDRFRFGWNVTLAANTMLGPVSLTFMGSKRRPILLEFHAGYRF